MTTKALSLTKIDRNIDWKDNPVPQKLDRAYDSQPVGVKPKEQNFNDEEDKPEE